jgi:predicted transcriptional regulator
MSTRSPDSARVLTFLKASNKPQSVQQIAEATRIPAQRVKSLMKNLVKFAHARNATPGHIPTTYAAVVDNIPREIPEVAGEGWRKTNILTQQPDRTTSVCAIATLTGRSGNISPDRLQLEQWLETVRTPYSVTEIAEKTGLGYNFIRHTINTMVAAGKIKNVNPPRRVPGLYILSHKMPREEKSTPPRTKYMSVEPYRWRYAEPARPEADDNLKRAMSRVGDELRPHKGPIYMASKVKHGEGGR